MKRNTHSKHKGNVQVSIILCCIAIIFIGGVAFLFHFWIPEYHTEGCLDKIAEEYCLDNNFTIRSDYYVGYTSFMCDREFDRVYGMRSKTFLFSPEEKNSCIKKESWSFKEYPLEDKE